MTQALELLDPDDAAARAEYERAFYRGFVHVTGNRLIRKLWAWDEAGERLATRVPYEDQRVYLRRDDGGRIQTAMAVNVRMRQLQSAAFGFAVPGDGAGCCELLTFFAVEHRDLQARLRFLRTCFEALRTQGLHTAYASTAARPLPTYRRIGGQLVDEGRIDGEARYFLRFTLARAWMRPPAAEPAASA